MEQAFIELHDSLILDMNKVRFHEVSIRLSNEIQNIPYTANKYEDGEIFPYISLLSEPSRIDEIPELKESKALYKAVQFLNSPESAFETFRINFWRQQDNEHCFTRSEIGLMFRNPVLAQSPINLYSFIGDLQLALLNDLDTRLNPICVDIQRFNNKFDGRQGFCGNLFFQGVSAEQGNADLDHEDVVMWFTSFMCDVSLRITTEF
ncbi:MAG: hypothetical protein ACFCVB_15110 [Nodosilinea sp.]